jgi:Zn-dependent protease
VFNFNRPDQSPFARDRYGAEVIPLGDPRRSANPWRAIAAHVRWEIVAGFLIVMGFFVFMLAQDQDKLRIPGTLGLVITGWIFSLCLHEFAHAATAYLGGDHSDGTRSYLSFNPLKYVNPLLSIVLPLAFILLGGIALPGGAVYVRRDLVRNRAWQSAISLAGPLMNVLCLGIIGLVFKLGLVNPHISVDFNTFTLTASPLAAALALLALFQALAIVLNLLPIPPLDGFGVIAPFLSRDVQQIAYSFGMFGLILIFLVLSQPTAINRAFFDVVDHILSWLNIDRVLAAIGLENFQFWVRQ